MRSRWRNGRRGCAPQETPRRSPDRAIGRKARGLLLALALLATGSAAWAISDPSEALPDPRQEARAEEIGRQLRCLVCQNESIEDSGAGLARDLRRIVREQVAAGRTDRQVIAWLVARYGNFVRLQPPFNALTLLLWASPLLALAAGAAAVLLARRQRSSPPAPLSAGERARLKQLLDP
jgi:cytochrome c-type biogenesis protein CcmH